MQSQKRAKGPVDRFFQAGSGLLLTALMANFVSCAATEYEWYYYIVSESAQLSDGQIYLTQAESDVIAFTNLQPAQSMLGTLLDFTLAWRIGGDESFADELPRATLGGDFTDTTGVTSHCSVDIALSAQPDYNETTGDFSVSINELARWNGCGDGELNLTNTVLIVDGRVLLRGHDKWCVEGDKCPLRLTHKSSTY